MGSDVTIFFKKGSIVFPSDFRGQGTDTAIKMALSRLSKGGKVKRLAHGIYYLPATDLKFGELMPSAEAVANQLAEREKVRIRPTGVYALNKPGLSTQVPAKLVYITDGHPRKFRIGKASVQFKATTPKKMALSGKISSLLILALDELDLRHIDEKTTEKIRLLLQKEDKDMLIEDLRLASGKVYDYLIKIIQQSDDRMVNTNR